ncbi:MAG: outer membrane lipid asymmetry maintenance protein MlaD [Pseudomonadota bacterium]
MKEGRLEFVVGVFVILGFLAFSYMAINMGGVKFLGSDSYSVYARFGSISGLKPGAFVEIAGVKVGKVTDIELDTANFDAKVVMDINKDIVLQIDTIASIRTAGIIGDKFVEISPGADDMTIEAGGEIIETESAVSIEKLISKYMFEN